MLHFIFDVTRVLRPRSRCGMPRCEGAMPSAMQPVGKRYRSQLRLIHGRERQPAVTMSASAPSTSPLKSPIGCTSSLYNCAHFLHFARSKSTKREPTAKSSDANIAAPRRPEEHQHPCIKPAFHSMLADKKTPLHHRHRHRNHLGPCLRYEDDPGAASKEQRASNFRLWQIPQMVTAG